MISNNIPFAIDALIKGELVAIPTETVYGLAGNALNEQVVNKIFHLKNRPSCNPLILHTHSINEVLKYVHYLPPAALKLAETFWPGPLTLLVPKKQNILHNVTSGSHLVAVRIPNHPITLSLLQQLDFPLVAPSANPYTRISPTNAQMVYDYFGEDLPVILDGGNCAMGIESTIVGFQDNSPIVYRQGAISVDALEFIAGKSKVLATKTDRVTTPGMSPMHYAPKTKFIIVDHIQQFITAHPDLKIGVIDFGESLFTQPNVKRVNLSKCKDLEEASSNLYKTMYDLDKLNLDCIIIESFPEMSLGKSLNDRIRRASFR